MATTKSKKTGDTADLMIFTEVGEIDTAYPTAKVDIMERLPFSQFDTIKMCEFYSNSKYLNGNKDELDRDKPFYNIVNYRVTLAKVATDLDTADIRIEADHPKYSIKAMFLQHELYKWMKEPEVNFAGFLNKFGLVRPKYGGVITKKVETNNTLCIDIADWRNIVTDLIDILGGVKIEKHFMTPVDLSMKKGVWSDTTEAIKAQAKLNQKQKKSKNYAQEEAYNSDRIEVQEVTGQFPIAYYKEADGEEYKESDKWSFSKQRYFLSIIGDKKFVFFCEENKEDIYKYAPWEEMPGRALGRGVIEDSEEAQVWTNDAVINEKNAMDLAGKVMATTDDPDVGNNLLTADNGKIFNLGEGKTLSSLKLDPAALGEFQNQINKWEKQANYATSSFDSNNGEAPTSGTPYSTVALLNQVASKPFDFRREEAGIFIGQMITEWVIPFLIKRLNKSHVLTSEFSDDELRIIDHSFAVDEANKATIDHVISTGMVPSPDEYMGMIDYKRKHLSGNKRSIEFPEGYFDDAVVNCTVVTTGEQQNKAATLSSLANLLKQVSDSYNPQTGKFMILADPQLAAIFGKIVEMTGINVSPASFGIDPNTSTQQNQPIPVQQAPTQPAPSALPTQAPVVQ